MKTPNDEIVKYINNDSSSIKTIDEYIEECQIDELMDIRGHFIDKKFEGRYLVCHEKVKELRNDKVTILDNISVIIHSYTKIQEIIEWLGQDKIHALQSNDLSMFTEYELLCIRDIVEAIKYLQEFEKEIMIANDCWDDFKKALISDIDSLVREYDKVLIIEHKKTLS